MINICFKLQKCQTKESFSQTVILIAKEELNCTDAKLIWIQNGHFLVPKKPKEKLNVKASEDQTQNSMEFETVNINEGIAGEVVASGRDSVVLDMLSHPLFSKLVDLESNLPVAVFPFRAQKTQKLIGVIQLPLLVRNTEAKIPNNILEMNDISFHSDPRLSHHRVFVEIISKTIQFADHWQKEKE